MTLTDLVDPTSLIIPRGSLDLPPEGHYEVAMLNNLYSSSVNFAIIWGERHLAILTSDAFTDKTNVIAVLSINSIYSSKFAGYTIKGVFSVIERPLVLELAAADGHRLLVEFVTSYDALTQTISFVTEYTLATIPAENPECLTRLAIFTTSVIRYCKNVPNNQVHRINIKTLEMEYLEVFSHAATIRDIAYINSDRLVLNIDSHIAFYTLSTKSLKYLPYDTDFSFYEYSKERVYFLSKDYYMYAVGTQESQVAKKLYKFTTETSDCEFLESASASLFFYCKADGRSQLIFHVVDRDVQQVVADKPRSEYKDCSLVYRRTNELLCVYRRESVLSWSRARLFPPTSVFKFAHTDSVPCPHFLKSCSVTPLTLNYHAFHFYVMKASPSNAFLIPNYDTPFIHWNFEQNQNQLRIADDFTGYVDDVSIFDSRSNVATNDKVSNKLFEVTIRRWYQSEFKKPPYKVKFQKVFVQSDFQTLVQLLLRLLPPLLRDRTALPEPCHPELQGRHRVHPRHLRRGPGVRHLPQPALLAILRQGGQVHHLRHESLGRLGLLGGRERLQRPCVRRPRPPLRVRGELVPGGRHLLHPEQARRQRPAGPAVVRRLQDV